MLGDSFELKRKVFHIILGVIIVLLINFDILEFWMALTLLLTGLVISFVSIKNSIPLIKWFLDQFDRPRHKGFPGKGVVAIMFSITLLILLYETSMLSKSIVLASLMIWVFGDSFTAIIGREYGRIKHPLNNSRFIEGTVSGIVAGMLAAYIFVPLPAALMASFIAITIESLELRLMKNPVDDNLLVPLISAVILYAIL
ncbi:TPA: hypothetical protein HA235_01560 [Candidatus Woesearchaeota archaeon]|nr:hypothetical protein [Candidatus Woesearchaeota archaeon]HIH31371.1 hypothetical protein [Candidatus Woesearchaeota archaeon]HIH54423.1 hypothetical protein [Candidatus Woesearchaeota archaeon]HIJ02378.1 hypothetical protein [Candidatus Woesearchaeota archaeon]HIJ14144.1 hypothetical protein [Candidatus Woesearchaeota archaeon]